MLCECQACGKHIEKSPSNIGRYTFCSYECKKVNCIEIKCTVCGKPYKTNGYGIGESKYCSDKCRNAKTRELQSHKSLPHVDKNCACCGKTFRVRRSIADKQKYCSKSCFAKSFIPKFGADNPHYKQKIQKTCPVCNKTFEVPPSRNDRVYCSAKCRDYKVEVHCQNCGKSMHLQPSRAKERVYCSTDCQLSHQATLRYDDRRTSIEKKMAELLDSMHLPFWEQYPVDWYTCDFYLPGYEIIIECDGDYWHSRPEAIRNDNRKNKLLAKRKYTVLRFSETSINTDLSGCKKKIMQAIKQSPKI